MAAMEKEEVSERGYPLGVEIALLTHEELANYAIDITRSLEKERDTSAKLRRSVQSKTEKLVTIYNSKKPKAFVYLKELQKTQKACFKHKHRYKRLREGLRGVLPDPDTSYRVKKRIKHLLGGSKRPFGKTIKTIKKIINIFRGA